jgi:predicted DCC family thiol-disulfide oxidoreductase YuxK
MGGLPPRIVLYDGVCGLCDRLVQFLVARDRARLLRYAPLQGDTAAGLRTQHDAIPQDLDTMVFVDEGVVYLRSRAAARIARYLPWPWRLASLVRFVPRFVADAVYGWVARSRYRIFGKVEACGLPTAEERKLLLP